MVLIGHGEEIMPCSISDDEARYYEKEHNRERYGVSELDARINATVACELGKIIAECGLLSHVSDLACKWLENHALEDEER